LTRDFAGALRLPAAFATLDFDLLREEEGRLAVALGIEVSS
jgi:hypothetical protein